MSKLIKSYETKLETAGSNEIAAILDAKLDATNPQRVTDYVSFAVDNLDSQIKRMKEYKAELDMMISLAEQQKHRIKTGTADWLAASGIDSLHGDIVSSMKITQPKAKETLNILDADALINGGYFKTEVDKTAVKNALQSGLYVDGAELNVEHQEETLTIYKRRNVTKSKED